MSQAYYLIAFNSINHANYFESELRKYGHKVIMIETPEYLTKDYYVALRITEDALLLAKEKIRETNLEQFKIYKECLQNGKKAHKEILLKEEEYDKELLEMLFPSGGIQLDNSDENVDEAAEIIEKDAGKRKNNEKTEAYNGVSIETTEGNEQAEEKTKLEKESTLKCSEKKLVGEQRSSPVELIKRLIHIGKQANRL